ncbi:MAG: hypothetical protein DMG13_13960 [Acidobacteria bacterium]|nr:MAG: hypothetical protein DMG13_13960 [Acidobacteriota bacterium]
MLETQTTAYSRGYGLPPLRGLTLVLAQGFWKVLNLMQKLRTISAEKRRAAPFPRSKLCGFQQK